MKRPITPQIGTLALVVAGVVGVPLMWAVEMRVNTGDWIYAGCCLLLGALFALAVWMRRRRMASSGLERLVAESPEVLGELATRRQEAVRLIAEKHKARLRLEAVHRESDPTPARVSHYEAALREEEERVELTKREMLALEQRGQELTRRQESERFNGDERQLALHLLEERDSKINEIVWETRLDVPFANFKELFPDLVERIELAKRSGNDALRANCEQELSAAVHSLMESWKQRVLELEVRKKAIQDKYAAKLADLKED